jgi:hypothetical protein
MSDDWLKKNDAQEVKEILGVVSTEIPKLLDSISNTIYNADKAQEFGKSVAAFFKQMKEAGMDDKQAYDLTEKFMANFSMGGMISNIFSGLVGGDDEIGKKINEKIKKKLDEDDE